jgi:hypothetical protein
MFTALLARVGLRDTGRRLCLVGVADGVKFVAKSW